MTSAPTVTVHLDRKCAECGKGGAVDSGICLGCTNKAIRGTPMKSPTGRAVQERWKRQAEELQRSLGKR
jgi:hypothetical protein